MKNKNAGFSLIELIVVIAAMVIVAGIGLTWFGNISGYRARECCSKISSSLTGSKIKSLSKTQNTGDSYWELHIGDDNKYFVKTVYPNYQGGSDDVEDVKVAKSSNVKVKYTVHNKSTGVSTDKDVDASNPLRLSYDRSTGAIYVWDTTTNTISNDLNINKISVSSGSRTYEINIVAKTGKVLGRN